MITLMPHPIRAAAAISWMIPPDGLVSLPITHVPDRITPANPPQNRRTSASAKSSPATPLMPEIVAFTREMGR